MLQAASRGSRTSPPRRTVKRAAVSLFVAGLAYYRFQWLIDWTYRVTCDFYLQMRSAAGLMAKRKVE